MTSNEIKSTRGCAALAGLFAVALMAVAIPASAASPVFPIGSRLGLVPPAGMQMSKKFPGFEDLDKHAAIFISTLPAAAYSGVEGSDAEEALKKQGIIIEKREPVQLSIGKGILVIGKQTGPDKVQYRKWMLVAGGTDLTALVSVQVPEDSNAYPDSVVRAALATLSERNSVPDTELLSLLPFTVGNLAGFRLDNIIPGRALLLTDAPDMPHMVVTNGIPQYDLDARLIVAALPGGPADKDGRPEFARLAFSSIGGIKDIQITMSEPVRIDNEEAFETVAHAKDIRTDSAVMVVQWLRFGNGGFLQVVGISRAQIWDDELTRLRALRDSIQMK
jgi:hypothetical protein